MITLAQIPVSTDIGNNLEMVKQALSQVWEGAVVVFPEGALSGYAPETEDFVTNIDFTKLAEAHEYCEQIAKEKNIAILIGSVEKDRDAFYNSTFIFTPEHPPQVYRKVNLAFHDKKHFEAGSELPIFKIKGIAVGVQMCRELLFPEQWRTLSLKGAQVLMHLNNTIGTEKYELWRSLLISRAGENQRCVVSVNCASAGQGCPTMAVSPKGKPIVEIRSNTAAIKELSLDLSEVQDYYLGQRRTDLG